LQDQLGLFDTPPDRQEIRLSLVLVALLYAALALLLALPDIRLRQIDAFIPMVDAIMFVGDMITATLLYMQASIFRSRALTVLASAYFFTGLLLVAHVLTFPGAFAPGGLLGAGINTTAWISTFWRAAPPIAIIIYVFIKKSESASRTVTERPRPKIAIGALMAVALAAAVTLLTTRGHDLLPQLFLNRQDVDYASIFKLNCILITLFIVAFAVLFRNRKSVLDLWLLVALSAWLAHAFLNLPAWGRFTVSFYSQFSMLLFSHFVVMLALMAETNRLYGRLVLTTAARERERDARLMSMDAVAAAISHEVGQPLAAVTTNAMAGLNWLNRSKPNVEMAIMAQQATIEAGQRTFDVIKSVRAMFTKRQAAQSEYDLNDLVRETARLLERELTSTKVSVELALDDALPLIRADRVQVQRVLVNLFSNAMESLAGTRGRPRQILVQTLPSGSKDVLLEVSDNGVGISPEEIEHIFEAFVTTKATGIGLGLSLCRTIVQEHGGLLWASQGDEYGATFHLRLPCG